MRGAGLNVWVSRSWLAAQVTRPSAWPTLGSVALAIYVLLHLALVV